MGTMRSSPLLPVIVQPLPLKVMLLLRVMDLTAPPDDPEFPEFLRFTVPELMAAMQALAAANMSLPVYLMVPSTLPVQVLPDSVTSPVAANKDVCRRASADTTISFFIVLSFFAFWFWLQWHGMRSPCLHFTVAICSFALFQVALLDDEIYLPSSRDLAEVQVFRSPVGRNA